MSQVQGAGAGQDLSALRAQMLALSGPAPQAVVACAPEQPTPCARESYGGSVGKVKRFLQDHPRISTAAVAIGAASVASRTNPFRYLGDRLYTASRTVAGAVAGGIGSWVALHQGAELLTQAAHAVSLSTGLVDGATAVGLVVLGGWAGKSYANHRLAERDAAAAATAAAKARAAGKQPPSGAPANLGRSALLVLAGAAIPHIVAKAKERSQS